MGFIYTKPLSIEGVFSKFDTNGDGIISSEEKKAAKNMDVFTSFKLKNGMTSETFENENRNKYARYEQAATHAYDKQKARINSWLDAKQEEMDILKDYELAELDRMEKELEKEKEEMEKELQARKEKFDLIALIKTKLAKDGVPISDELQSLWSSMSAESLKYLLDVISGK